MKIKTKHGLALRINRSMDWAAWDEDDADSVVGYGATEQEAIEDFLGKIENTENEIQTKNSY